MIYLSKIKPRSKYLIVIGLLLHYSFLIISCTENPNEINAIPPPQINQPVWDSVAYQAYKQIEELAKDTKKSGKIDSAICQMHRTLAFGRQYLQFPDTLLSKSLYRLGVYQSEGGYIESSRLSFQEGINIVLARPFKNKNDSIELGRLFNSISAQFNRAMQLKEAESFARKSVEIKEKLFGKNSQTYSISLSVLGEILKTKGNLAEAAKVLKAKVHIDSTNGEKVLLAEAYQSLGEVLILQKQFENARLQFENGIKILNVKDYQKNEKEYFALCKNKEGLAKVAYEIRDTEKGSKLIDSALKELLGFAQPTNRELGLILQTKADAESEAGNFQDALKSYHAMFCSMAPMLRDTQTTYLPGISEIGTEPGVFYALCGKAYALGRISIVNGPLAMDLYRKAFDFYRNLQSDLREIGSKIQLMTSLNQELSKALDLGIHLYHVTNEHRYLEDCYSFMAYFNLEQPRSELQMFALTEKLFPADTLIMAWQKTISSLQEARNKGADPTKLAKYLSDSIALSNRMEVNDFEPQFTNDNLWKDLKKRWTGGPDTLVLAYHKTNDYFYVWGAAGNLDTLIRVSIDSTLLSAITIFQKNCKNSALKIVDAKNEYLRSGKIVFESLVKPLLRLSGYPSGFPERVFIQPASGFEYIPFEALPINSSHFQPSKRNNYWLFQSVISYVASFNEKKSANDTQTNLLDRKQIAFGHGSLLHENLKNILIKRGANLYQNSACNEAELKNVIKKTKELHITAHGFGNPTNPLSAYIELEGADTDDGKLTAYEVYHLRHNTDLTVLSTCQSGFGSWLPGIGMASIGRAFVESGSKQVIQSLSFVESNHTADILTYFYEELEKINDAALALQKAKIKAIENASIHEITPFYWANITLLGGVNCTVKTRDYSMHLSWELPLMMGILLCTLFLISRKHLAKPS